MGAATAHTHIARFKPHTFGKGFRLYSNSISYGRTDIERVWDVDKRPLTGVSVTLGAGNKTIEIKNGATWTFGVVKVSKLKRTAAAAFKVLVDNAVTAAPTYAPRFTSFPRAVFVVGDAASTFSVDLATTTANAIVTKTGNLPTGVTLTDKGDGTGATIAGTPAAGTAGTYPLTLTATSTTTPAATQSFTLVVKP
jgi:hypothetical protein